MYYTAPNHLLWNHPLLLASCGDGSRFKGGEGGGCLCPGDPAPSGPPLGPLRRSVEPPVRAGDQAPREPTLGPLRHSAAVRLQPQDPAPSGPPLGPLRCPVERNGGRSKGRNLRQKRGGQNQGRRRSHSAAYSTRDTMQARNAWRSRAPGPHAHRKAARQVVDGLRTEVCGQQKQSNDPRNNQHNPNTPTTGLRERGNDISRSTARSGRQKAPHHWLGGPHRRKWNGTCV